MSRLIDLTGRRFGKLKVLNRDVDSNKRGVIWKCLCDCGNITSVRRVSLLSNATKSCGCLAKMNAATHGMSDTPTYNCWRSMRSRCNNSDNKDYPNYGGRGIKVCDAWNSFDCFYADMGERPVGTTIERLDNNIDYDAVNCVWANAKDQANNRRTNNVITYNGVSRNISQWASALNMSDSTLRSRLYLYKWSIERALTEPVYRKVI